MTKKMLVFAAGALLLPLAYAIDYPEVKEGLWSIHTQTSNNLSPKMDEGNSTICRDHAYDKSVQAMAKAMKGCTTVSESMQGGKYTAELRCVVAGTTIDSKATAIFQGDTSHSESHATYTPAMQGLSEMTMIQDQKYMGSCPAGMKPGDRTDDKGNVIHASGSVTRSGNH